MPNKTTNMGLYKFLENEPVDYSLINENFENIDKLATVVESGTKTATYNDGSTSGKIATWYYKKYSDGVVEISARLPYSDELCTGGTASPYYSGHTNINFPVTFHPDKIRDLQVTMVSAKWLSWCSVESTRAVSDKISVRFLGFDKDTDAVSRYLYINVKGELQ